MSKSTVLLNFENFFFFTVLCSTAYCAVLSSKHINGTGCNIFNFYVENQSCNPY